MLYRANAAAAAIHSFMSAHPAFGYDQANRWFESGTAIPFEYQGITFYIPTGDGDCVSSCLKAWQIALEPTPYAGALGHDGYNASGFYVSWYTGNAEGGLKASGLFESKPMSFFADTGDLYLNHRYDVNTGLYSGHMAMCQSQYPDILSEFVLNEFGGITGGQTGDQTDGESRIVPYYDFPWDCILHYNGKADFEMEITMAKPIDVWAYKNDNLTDLDAYAHLLETHSETKQILRECVRLGSEVSQLKMEVASLKSAIERSTE